MAEFKPEIVDTDFDKEQELPSLEETFENAKQVFINTAEVAVVISDRLDNLVNIRNAVIEFWGKNKLDEHLTKENISYFKELQKMITDTYAEILNVVKEFELDEFCKDDMKDYFEDLMPTPDEIETESDLFEAWLVASTVKPWGEKMTALHHQILDEMHIRQPIEGSDEE